MDSPYQLLLRRIERANVQRAELDREIDRWVDEGAYQIRENFDRNTGNTLYCVEKIADPSPLMLALIAETVHSLRAALDNLAYQLFLISRTDPADDGAYMFFPIYDDTKPSKSDPLSPIKSLKRKEIVELVRRINPCKTGNPTLWSIHKLDIVDKHRRFLTCSLVHHGVNIHGVLRQMAIDVGYSDMLAFIPARYQSLTSHRTGKRAEVGDVLFVGLPGDEKVNENLKFTFDVSFAEPGIVEGKSIRETLDEMIVEVDGTIASFKPFLL